MKLRFFGDSWYWSWFYPENESGHLKSKLLSNTCYNGQGFPILEVYLKYMGIDAINHCYPGFTFTDTVNSVVSKKAEDVKYNVVFFSSHYRRKDTSLDITSYYNFLQEWENKTLDGLKLLDSWAKKCNQIILLVGAHSTLYKETIEKVKSNNLHIVSECILADILSRKRPFGTLKFANDIVDYIDESFDKDLINHLYNNLTEIDKATDKQIFTHPDHCHLNPTGALFLIDRILHKIEQIQGE